MIKNLLLKIIFFVAIFIPNKNINGQSWADILIDNSTKYFDMFLDDAMKSEGRNNPGAAFVSACLRGFPFAEYSFPNLTAYLTEGPSTEDCQIQLRCALEQRGFSKPVFDASLLKKGDVVFTEDQAPYANELWPTHAFFFIEWVSKGSTNSALILDYHGAYIERNITGEGEYVKFQYFMRSPFDSIPNQASNIETNLNQQQTIVYPNPANETVNIMLNTNTNSDFNITIKNVTAQTIYRDKINCNPVTKLTIDTQEFKSGMYFLIIEEYSDYKKIKNTIVRKILISK